MTYAINKEKVDWQKGSPENVGTARAEEEEEEEQGWRNRRNGREKG